MSSHYINRSISLISLIDSDSRDHLRSFWSATCSWFSTIILLSSIIFVLWHRETSKLHKYLHSLRVFSSRCARNTLFFFQSLNLMFSFSKHWNHLITSRFLFLISRSLFSLSSFLLFSFGNFISHSAASSSLIFTFSFLRTCRASSRRIDLVIFLSMFSHMLIVLSFRFDSYSVINSTIS